MLYRVNRELTTGKIPGDIVSDKQLSPRIIKILVRKHLIVKLDSPPLTYMTGWARRAELLAPLGIYNIVDFLEADDDVIREAWGHKSVRGVQKAKKDLWTMMDIPQEVRN